MTTQTIKIVTATEVTGPANRRSQQRTTRRRTLGLLIAAGVLGASAHVPSLAQANTAQGRQEIRIGYQKYGTLTLLKGRGTLEQRLAGKNVTVKWTEFPAGPQLLEGLNVGSVDFGTVGEAPPIFAQAAGANLVYVGNEPPSPASEAIVVPKSSTVRSVADLKGKKIVLNKGSNVHYLLVKALEKAGVAYQDVQVIYLPPADARAAFERGSVDAWVIWDPFLAAAEKQIGARLLADGKGLVNNYQFYLAARPYAEKNRDTVRIVLEEIAKVDEWGAAHPKEVAAILSTQTGLQTDIVALAASRYAYGVKPITAGVLEQQQKVADAFANLKLIPKPIAVKDAQLGASQLARK
ncbi:sulfonate transport system substrate-binding protein [Duganella sp. 3397]|uniref:sulfonate ABC transporter substrate-binding protein n=1 Tax=Duganella sp. 3397 TaxID=2817732 RepID=UPI002863D57D|nr:sulfonate ABC transporter substrate-binding protein [Duganella sp. 3397]MDR7049441.1 sulfonate transport system substrate-binding protein [Duganella sp. 3397]